MGGHDGRSLRLAGCASVLQRQAVECVLGGSVSTAHVGEELMEVPVTERTIRGRVKWFNAQKGYGFVLDEAGREYFVHHTSIAVDGYRALSVGEPVEFAPRNGPKGLAAHHVRKMVAVHGKSPQETTTCRLARSPWGWYKMQDGT
jgi:cold shock protein